MRHGRAVAADPDVVEAGHAEARVDEDPSALVACRAKRVKELRLRRPGTLPLVRDVGPTLGAFLK